jgi:predicted nucleic acid-binding protein
MSLLLDTGVLGKICHPKREQHGPVLARLDQWLDGKPQLTVYLPEIADYELRRKYLHMDMLKSLQRLDELAKQLVYLPLSTPIMQQAAELWARVRRAGKPTASDKAIDGDVILAAQAMSVNAIVATTNVKHISLFVRVEDWSNP